MKVICTARQCRIVEATQPEKLAADRALSIRHPKFMFMQAYRSGCWNGVIRFIRGRRFPAGLLHVLIRKLQKKGFYVEIEYEGVETLPSVKATPDMLFGIQLRDKQIEAIDKLVEVKRCIFDGITSSGKTEVMAGVIKALGMPKTLVLIKGIQLMSQTAERLSLRLQAEVGLIHEGTAEFDAQVVVCSIDTLARRLEDQKFARWLETEVKVVFADECHLVPGKTFSTCLEAVGAAYRYGLSATALDVDNQLANLTLIGQTGEIAARITFQDQIQRGLIDIPNIFFKTVGGFNELKHHDKNDDYLSAYNEGAIELGQKNASIVDDCLWFAAHKLPTLILVEKRRHGRLIQSNLQAAGLRSRYMDGNTSVDARRGAVREFARGVLQVIVTTRIFNVGVDIPAIKAIILADEGVTPRKTIQQVGRGMRITPGLPKVLYVRDYVNQTCQYLLEHSLARVRVYKGTKAYVVHKRDTPLKWVA